MEQISEEFKKRLGDIGGRLPNGTPKLRLVFGPDARRPHGKLAGTLKYLDPETGKPYPWWVLELWIPPSLCGTREAWSNEYFGPYPADCHLDCCNGGFWGLKTVIHSNGEFLPINESVMQSIERKQYLDVEFSLLDEKERLAVLDAQLSERETNADAKSLEEYIALSDHYFAHKEGEDNADNRIFVFPESIQPQAKGIREAIGRPNIKV